MLGNQLGFLDIPKANAQITTATGATTGATIGPTIGSTTGNHDELGLIAILVEKELLDDTELRTQIFKYAKNVKSRIPHSQSMVFGIDKNENTFKIASVLEKLYFEGMDSDEIDTNSWNDDDEIEDDNKLAGVVLIGDVPVPVVHESDGSAYPSLYPYTDFYRKGYIYNHKTDKFEVNGDVSTPNPEIWHGVIVPPSKDDNKRIEQLIVFFEKNEAYSNGISEYTDFDKRMLYANYPAMEEQMNFMDYRNYERYNVYMEEMAFNRYNKHLLKELIQEVSVDMESDEMIMPEDVIDTMMDVSTEFIFKKYTAPLAFALQIHLGKINDALKLTGRWSTSEVDTPASLVTMRDEYAKRTLHRNQLLLEAEVDNLIKATIPASNRKSEIVTDAKLKVKTEIPVIGTGTKTFTFHSYIDGTLVSNMQSVEDCGIYLGQKRGIDENVLENNSVYAEANQLYDPDSLIEPPDDDWELEEDEDYLNYAGCVFNNSIKIDAGDLHLDPDKCKKEEAIRSIFSIRGSREVETEISSEDLCSMDRMSFHPGSDDVFGQDAKSGGLSSVTLSSVINKVYNKLYDNEDVYIEPAYNLRQKASAVVKAMLKTGATVKYSPDIFGIDAVDLTISVSESGAKEVDSFMTHVEPTNETIRIIKQIPDGGCTDDSGFPEIVTPSTPADGIRYVEFAKNGNSKKIDYLNLYRIGGSSTAEIYSNLLSKINAKDIELSNKLDTSTNITLQFINDHSDVTEPAVWNSMGADQKLINIIPKYVDKDSLLPEPEASPGKIQRPPVIKPNGYEVLHIVAEGDPWGYQIGLNRAMRPAPEIEDGDGEDEEGDGDGDGEDEEGDGDGEDDYKCGDPSGVEIWEWFGAIQCWIEEEILVMDELIKLDDSCGAVAPSPDEDEELEDLIPLDPLEDTSQIPVQLNAVMGRKSLVVGEAEIIRLYPLNADGQSIFGYIEDPVHLELENSNLGVFEKNDFHIFTGEESLQFTAQQTGSTDLAITMSDLTPASFPINVNVYDSIKMDWDNEEVTVEGKTAFKIKISLKNPSNQAITNVNTDVLLAPLKPSDGRFEKGGKAQLINGYGEILFFPTPGPTEIKLISKDPYYTSSPHSIFPPPGLPVQLVIKPPRYISVGDTVNIPVTASDIYGNTVKNFNETIELSLHEDTEDYATIQNPALTISNGKGNIQIKAGKLTGEIQLIADHNDLKKGIVNIPILARMESEDWATTYPENLFASFVGFPAGNFLEEDYFGGTHLFSGKTEAVFSFMTGPTPTPILTINSNYKIIPGPKQQVLIEFPNKKLLLQVLDTNNLQTLISETISLNFDAVDLWDEGIQLQNNMMYLDVINDSYQIEEINQGFDLSDAFGKNILKLRPDNIILPDPSYYLTYNNYPEFDAIELILTNGVEEIARVFLNFNLTSLNVDDFDEINEYYVIQKTFGGKSTNDPNGLVFYDPRAEIEEENRGEYFGFEGNNKYISLFASGAPVGDAIKFNLPTNAVLLGDPTIKLQTKTSGGLDYDNSIGRKIFQDHEGSSIASINKFNFNNDYYEDVVMVMQDGRIKLMEGGPTDPIFKDKGDIAFLADGAVAVENFDFADDGYEDILVATKEGRLAILHNDREVLKRTDQKIKVGKQLYVLLKGDMDADGFEDLVTLDSRGDIRIFYNNNNQFPENGKLIGNYGFSLKLGQNLYKDLDVRYPGLDPPNTGFGGISSSSLPLPDLPVPSIEPSASQQSSLEDFLDGNVSNPSESQSNELYDALKQMADAAREDPAGAINATKPPLLPWPEENETATKSDDELETYFAPVEDVSFLNIEKTVHNKERPNAKNIDLEENLVYTIQITSNINKNNVVLADTVPDSLTPLLDTANCEGNGCENFTTEQVDIRLFLAGLDLKANQTITITYEVVVAHTPQAAMFIQKLTKPTSINDQYLDIVVSPPYNNTGDLIQHYTTASRTYDIRSTSQNIKPQTLRAKAVTDAIAVNQNMVAGLLEIENQDYDEDNQTSFNAVFGNMPPGSITAVCEEMGGGTCFESADSVIGCIDGFLDDLAGLINDFACMGGGCFPMPWNRAFLVPPAALPIFAFPAGPGPYPMPGSLAMPGVATVPGTFQSIIRFYLSPTLTGGIGIAMCWGPYMGNATPPPPVFPIPYPPPIGNCMVTALPRSVINTITFEACDMMEDFMNLAVQTITSGINKINSAAASINNNDSIPVGVESGGGSEEGAGGLEISLGVNLGESMKFEPPLKSFSNIHIPTFDSLMGVISGWVDRQTLEIVNKLFTLPTFYIYLPDFKSLFTLDFDRTKKQANIWWENTSKSQEQTIKTLASISQLPPQPDIDGGGEGGVADSIFDDIRMGLERGESSKALKYMDAIEAQAGIDLSALQGLYDVASAFPLVNITEKPIEFKVPWISAGEIQAYIVEMQRWVLYYQRELARVTDIWEKYTCDGFDEGMSECVLRQVADAFIVDFEPILESVQENIEVMQLWLAFPRQFVKYKEKLVDYIRQVACYFNVTAQMMGGWMAELQEGLISWAELILTIWEIIKNWKQLFDIFIDFDTSCSICTNERYANFGWWMLLGLIIPDIPIISFPKWPDIVLDMSNVDAAINIDLPILHITPEPLPLPPLPYIRLPNIPSLQFMIAIPPLPVIPRPPEFPDLPDLPPIPVVDLPTLPPPPKLPDIGMAFEVIIPLIEKILKIWCLLKKALAPVPESMLGDQIALLTNRPSYLIPLDILKLQLPNIAPFDLGFNELRIETVVYFGLRIKVVSKALEGMSDQWNEWIEAIPKEMKKFYQEKIIDLEEKAQEKMDEIEQTVADKFAEWEEDVAGVTDDWEEAVESWDDYFREKEQEMQDDIDSLNIGWDYQDYVNAINDFNEIINTKFIQWRDDLDDIFDEFREFTPYLTAFFFSPMANLLEELDRMDLEPAIQDKVFDNIGQGLDFINALPATCTTNITDCWSAFQDLLDYMQECVDNKEACETDYFSLRNPDSKQLASELQDLVGELIATIGDINNTKLVDYTLLKEKYNVPDFEFESRPTTVDKIKWMEKELIAYSDKLENEAGRMQNVKDLYALAEAIPRSAFEYELASEEYQPIIDTEEKRVFTSAIIPKGNIETYVETQDLASKNEAEIQETVERKVQAGGEEGEVDTGFCTGVCLPDPATNQPTPFIPTIEYPILSETLFLDSGHVVYSDGTGLYLKRDLTVLDPLVNFGGDVPDKIFEIEDLAVKFWYTTEPIESINMLRTTLTENGSASFNWNDVTNPELYGYGIELERSILGYDSDEQENDLPDTKFVLLAPDENGDAPEVVVDGRKVISFGTLVTSMEDAEEAKQYFGINAKNVITNAETVTFTTIGNATISLDENTAVMYDQYTSAAYSINMENGFYHIKMTWFDDDGRLSTYNHNELLSPQIYAGSAPPIDIAFDKIYYVPIYKEKLIEASKIFVDLGSAYNYYWFDKNNNPLIPGESDKYLLPPQYEPKEKIIKLVATQDIEDDSFERFEKTFKVVVYVPKIDIEQNPLSKKGTVTGSMHNIPEEPTDNLSDIPFSLFRKRWNTWKNLGLLMNQKESVTEPPLNDHEDKKYIYEDSYYSLDSGGGYIITGLDTSDPSPIIVKDSTGNTVAKITPVTGRIELLDDNYELLALPAAIDLPTRIAVIEKGTELIVANVYYVSDANTDITIEPEPLTVDNVSVIGVTTGDANPEDDIIAKNIPGYAPSYPGGVAIYNQTPPQINVALVDTDGSIRMMQADYKLRIKNEEIENERYIFQIINEDDTPIYDVYIHANFDNLQIKQDQMMEDTGIQIGLNEKPERMFAPSIPQELHKSSTTAPQQENPFPDLDSAHPFFSEILELYKRRVISGYGDGTFKPDSQLTRAEFIKIALGVTNCFDCSHPTDPQREKYTPTIPFPDVRLPAWYYFCIWIAKDLEMITGYGDGLFRPARNISRAEAVAVLLRQSQIEINEAPEEAFADVQDYAWYKDYVYTAVQIGLIKETGGFVFPDEEITRGEFAFMGMGVVNMLDCREVDEDEDGMPDWWEMENNLDPLFAGDALSDADEDGLTALEEYLKGMDKEDVEIEPAICPCQDNPNQDDTDGDGIIDACDIDLDNDGVSNALCLFDDEGNVDPAKLAASEDNCIFIVNADQIDQDTSDIGDICEYFPLCPCADNPNQNDTDGDKIIDVCDEDIDNDGIPNPICIFDDDGLIIPGIYTDNCLFVPNPDQIDSDMNQVGDECEPFDKCPPVPEDLDGVDDEDGCPELDDIFQDDEPGIYVVQGPACSFIDYEADLVDGDTIMTAITDIQTHDIIFESSNEIIYNP